jgi:thymidylate synthase (FAD)
MKILKPRTTIITDVNSAGLLSRIEAAGRTCYKSESRITTDSAKGFVKKIIDSGHHSVLEHESISVRIQCDRGITHEIVRHRIGASYSQESTRYCNYSKDSFGGEIFVIQPHGLSPVARETWRAAMFDAEISYFDLLREGALPQLARSVLPNSLKAEIVVTMNLRAWRHFFDLRTAPAAHPQMREIAKPLLSAFRRLAPVVFDDCGNPLGVYDHCPQCGSTEDPAVDCLMGSDKLPYCETCQWVGGYRPRMDWIALENEKSLTEQSGGVNG